MRIDRLEIRNFKGFERREFLLHPEFNLVVGDNGTGKTTLLEALSVAVGSWFLGLRGYDTRNIRSDDVRLLGQAAPGDVRWEQQFPCSVKATGAVNGRALVWERTLNSAKGRTSYGGARDIKQLAAETDAAVRRGEDVTLPLISSYNTGRLWNVPREQAKVQGTKQLKSRADLSRLEAYRNSVDPRVSVSDLVQWIVRESWRAFQKPGTPNPIFEVAKNALVQSVMGAEEIYFDAEYGEVVVRFFDHSSQPFNNLSDGQRCMLALIGDLARKAATLNPHLAEDALKKTPGIVLIDELDLHLHPKWQKRVIDDLRRIFPAVQFFCTTHSPFLIQSLKPGELINLDPEETGEYADRSIEDIAEYVMGVDLPQKSERYLKMIRAAEQYYTLLRKGADPTTVRSAEEQLDELSIPFSSDPAFQALLKLERATHGGSGDAPGR